MKTNLVKLIVLLVIATVLGFISRAMGMNNAQAMAIAVFSVSVMGTLFFWDFRISFVFLGTAILLATKAIDLEHLVKFSSLEIILFLIGMMIVVGLLKDAGFFAWIVSWILRIQNLTAKKFVFAISIISALLSCAVAEVTSIIFMVAAILEICDYFEVDPIPYIIISILATNIGSAGTVLGNPVGILIATRSGLTFEDFIIKAFPLAMLSLVVMIFIVMRWYKRDLEKLDQKIRDLGSNEILIRLISVPADKQTKTALYIFGASIVFIALSHRLDVWWGLENNTVLLIVPMVTAGLIMLWKHTKAQEFLEKDVEWGTLLFFLLLFAQTGTLKYTGATDVLALKITGITGHNPHFITAFVLWASTIGSSILDNVVMVAAFIPIVQEFSQFGIALQPLWWALLFGGCFGGNITLVGSTANIVALGILQKEKKIKIRFFTWFWIGLSVGVATTLVVWVALIVTPFYR